MTFVDKSDAFEHTKAKEKTKKNFCNELFKVLVETFFDAFCYFAVDSPKLSPISWLCRYDDTSYGLFSLLKIFYVNGLIINGARGSERELERHTSYSEHSRSVRR